MSERETDTLPVLEKAAEPPAPATPPAPPPFVAKPPLMAAAYAASSVILGTTQGLGTNLVSANLTGLQATFGATQLETGWLLAAYFATNMSATLLMFKVRTQFGLRRFAEIGIVVYALVVVAHLFINDLQSAIVMRAIMGIAAAPLGTLAFFYMLEWLPPARKLAIGIPFGLLGSNMALPLARVISPDLLQMGDWQGLFLLETGLALVCLAIIYILPITHPPRLKVFDWDDLISFPLMAIGFGCLGIVLSLGRSYWWLEAPWLGVLMAVGIGALVLLALVELHRKNPNVDLRWLSTGDMLTFAGSLMAFRLLLSEQSVGAFGLFTALGMQNEQLVPLFWMIGFVTFAATAVLSAVLKPARTPAIHLVALVLIAVGAWLDSQSTALSRPEQFYLSQALMGIAGGIFLPPALLNGFAKALARGPQFVLSFLTVFITTQTVGGILGSAVFGTFIALREQFHSNVIAQGITLLDPLVAQRVQLYGGVYSHVTSDPVQMQARGMALLSQSATLQANILAYNDFFLLIFGATLVVIAALLTHMLVSALSKPAAPMQAQAA